MKKQNESKMLTLALCIVSIVCFSQENKPAACLLGEIKNDSLLPFIRTLQINCNENEIPSFKKQSSLFTSLTCLIIKGEASAEDWTELFDLIKTKPVIKEMVFTGNGFESLPAGYQNLFNVETLTIANNEDMDYFETFKQLAELPNIRELTLDIYTIFDLPDETDKLKNLVKFNLINTDEYISETDTSSDFTMQEPITYDFFKNKDNTNYVSIKYTAMAGQLDSDEYLELRKRYKTSSAVFKFSESNLSEYYVPKYEHVNPPIKGMDVAVSRYTINPEIENALVYPSGTKIMVPANSFTDTEGNPVKGSVSLNYREFRDPVDILVSGIPMKYDSAGQSNNFESAGMFELTASIKNNPLVLAPGKKIDLNFNTTSKDSTYNFYMYNDSTGNWQYINKPAVVTSSKLINLKIYSDAFRTYRNLVNTKPRIPDTTKCANRFLSNDYTYTTRIDSNYVNGRNGYFKKRTSWFERQYVKVKITSIRKTKDGRVIFKVRPRFDSNLELNSFANLYFATVENITPAQFKKKYTRKPGFNDVRIYHDGGRAEIVLKDYKTFKKINTDVVTIDGKGMLQEVKYIKKVNKNYDKRLAYRERRFDKMLKRGRNVRDGWIELRDSNEVKKYAFGQAKKLMSSTEKKMSFDEWKTYYAQVTANEKAIVNRSAATAGNLVESLSLDGMGIYNCDQIRRIQEPVNVIASYKNKEGSIKKPQSTYIIDKKINGVLQYGVYEGKPMEIAFSKSNTAENVLVEVDENGTVGIYKTEEFRKHSFNNKDRFEFNVEKIDSEITTVADLKKIIGL